MFASVTQHVLIILCTCVRVYVCMCVNVDVCACICLFVCFLINTTLKLIIIGLQVEWKEHESFERRDTDIVELEAFSLKPHTLGF